MRTTTAVVGGGILGLATAREVLAREPDHAVTLFEKEHEVARHQSGHNSGVVHAGIYYRPGTLKATLTVRGRRALLDFCATHDIAVETCGKLIVALNESELAPLAEIERRSHVNGVPVRRLAAEEIAEIEPHATGIAGLHCPSTAVVDYRRVASALAEEVRDRGGAIRVGAGIIGLRHRRSGTRESVVVTSTSGEDEFDRVILCAGLQSDRVAALAGAPADPAIVPFRGEYHRLAPARSSLVRALIYPVPDPRYPFLGVHFTRRIDGTVEVGPNAILALGREGYRWSDINLTDLADMVRWPGFRRLAATHWRTALRELSGSLLSRVTVAQARRYLPELRAADLERAGSGVRAQAVDRTGALLDDFVIQRLGAVIAVRNAPSPAATASFAIAAHVVTAALA